MCFATSCLFHHNRTFHLIPASSVPAATGTVQVSTDSNGNTVIDLMVKHLARPSDLNPPKTSYVVWTESPGMPMENRGQLMVNDDLSASLRTVTALHNFELSITAENDPRAITPAGPVVLRASIQR